MVLKNRGVRRRTLRGFKSVGGLGMGVKELDKVWFSLAGVRDSGALI